MSYFLPHDIFVEKPKNIFIYILKKKIRKQKINLKNKKNRHTFVNINRCGLRGLETALS